MAHFILEITFYKTSGQDIFVASGKDDETLGSSHTRTFYDKQSLIEQTKAVYMPLSQSDKASLFNGETIRLIADEHDVELLGVWEETPSRLEGWMRYGKLRGFKSYDFVPSSRLAPLADKRSI